MKKIAIIFSKSPYGSNIGQLGLNFIISTLCYTENIGIFFIGDGIFQVIDYQNPKLILSKFYSSAFNILSLFNIKNIYLCKDSLINRGLDEKIKFLLKINICNFKYIKDKINTFDHILNF